MVPIFITQILAILGVPIPFRPEYPGEEALLGFLASLKVLIRIINRWLLASQGN